MRITILSIVCVLVSSCSKPGSYHPSRSRGLSQTAQMRLEETNSVLSRLKEINHEMAATVGRMKSDVAQASSDADACYARVRPAKAVAKKSLKTKSVSRPVLRHGASGVDAGS